MQAHWHPDFRIKSMLPDTRAIHTDFIIKMGLFTCVLIVLGFVLQREYQAYLLRQTISSLEQQIQSARSADLSRLEKSNRFRKLALNVKEMQRFFRAPFVAHELIVELASVKPEKLVFTRLVLSESFTQVKRGKQLNSRVTFKLNISGDVQALPILTQFKRKLEESLLLNPIGYTVSIDEIIQQRDIHTGIIPFQISVSLAPVVSALTSKELPNESIR